MHLHLAAGALYKMWEEGGIKTIAMLVALFFSVAIAAIPRCIVLCLAGEWFEKAGTPAGGYGVAVVGSGGVNV